MESFFMQRLQLIKYMRLSESLSHLNPLVPKLPSYIKDTTHFLKKLDDLKELPPGSLLVTLDVSSLYTNIPHNEGIEACRKALNSSDHLSRSHLNPISTGLFCLVVALGGGCFPPPSITPLSLKLDCSNFVQSYFEIG